MDASFPIRVGVVGMGFGQQVHVPCFRSDRRCAVEMIAASDRTRAKSLAESLGVRRYTGNWRELVESSHVDVVSIALPPHLQPEVALAALGAGKPVFCEKPLSVSAEQAAEMVSAASLAGRANMVDFEFPEIPAWQRAKDILDGGALGPLVEASVSWDVQTYANRHHVDCWKTRQDQGGGGLSNFGSHVFHYLEWLLGPVAIVSARMSRSPEDAGDADTAVELNLKVTSGAAAAVSIHTNAPGQSSHRVDIRCQNGALVLENLTADYMRGFRLRVEGPGAEACGLDDPGDFGVDLKDARVAAVQPIVRRFVDWIQSGTPGRPDFGTGLRIQRLIDAARLSHQPLQP